MSHLHLSPPSLSILLIPSTTPPTTTLTSLHPHRILYKIRREDAHIITCKPTRGVLQPGGTVTITPSLKSDDVTLHNTYTKIAVKSLEIPPHIPSDEIDELWELAAKDAFKICVLTVRIVDGETERRFRSRSSVTFGADEVRVFQQDTVREEKDVPADVPADVPSDVPSDYVAPSPVPAVGSSDSGKKKSKWGVFKRSSKTASNITNLAIDTNQESPTTTPAKRGSWFSRSPKQTPDEYTKTSPAGSSPLTTASTYDDTDLSSRFADGDGNPLSPPSSDGESMLSPATSDSDAGSVRRALTAALTYDDVDLNTRYVNADGTLLSPPSSDYEGVMEEGNAGDGGDEEVDEQPMPAKRKSWFKRKSSDAAKANPLSPASSHAYGSSNGEVGPLTPGSSDDESRVNSTDNQPPVTGEAKRKSWFKRKSSSKGNEVGQTGRPRLWTAPDEEDEPTSPEPTSPDPPSPDPQPVKKSSMWGSAKKKLGLKKKKLADVDADADAPLDNVPAVAHRLSLGTVTRAAIKRTPVLTITNHPPPSSTWTLAVKHCDELTADNLASYVTEAAADGTRTFADLTVLNLTDSIITDMGFLGDDHEHELKWPNLTDLVVSRVGLQLCHSTFNHLRHLTTIDLHSNELTQIPRLETPSLKSLNLSKNYITQIFRLDHLALEHLDLSDNIIATVDDIAEIMTLTDSLSTLNLTNNDVTTKGFYRKKVLEMVPGLKFLDNEATSTTYATLQVRRPFYFSRLLACSLTRSRCRLAA